MLSQFLGSIFEVCHLFCFQVFGNLQGSSLTQRWSSSGVPFYSRNHQRNHDIRPFLMYFWPFMSYRTYIYSPMSSIANHHLPIEKGNQINTCSKSGFFSTANQIKMKIVGKKFYTTFYLNFLSHDPTWWY